MPSTDGYVISGIIVLCAAISVYLVRLTKKPAKPRSSTESSDARAQQNLRNAVQRDAARKPQPRHRDSPWNSRPQASAQESDSRVARTGMTVVTLEEPPTTPTHQDNNPGGCDTTSSGDTPSGGSSE